MTLHTDVIEKVWQGHRIVDLAKDFANDHKAVLEKYEAQKMALARQAWKAIIRRAAEGDGTAIAWLEDHTDFNMQKDALNNDE